MKVKSFLPQNTRKGTKNCTCRERIYAFRNLLNPKNGMDKSISYNISAVNITKKRVIDMVNYNSTEYWKNATSYNSFELRSHRFRDDMLPVLFKWLGISENSKVLDGGCGTGVFTRYLAKGLTTGHITGFDISQAFIEFGNSKLKELGVKEKVTLEVADGHNLHYADNYFDAVTNYTYLDLLENQTVGLKELIRVCKKGGVVSTFGFIKTGAGGGFTGNYPFEGASRLIMLLDKSYEIFNDLRNKGKPTELSEPVLFESCGLSEINIFPFAHLMCYNNSELPIEYRKTLAISETSDELRMAKGRYSENKDKYNEQGFTIDNQNELISLLERKIEYLTNHFESDKSYEWRGTLNYIVTGVKK